MTEVYLIRHSKPLKVENIKTKDSLQLQNEKQILSIEGEKIAKEKFNNNEFNNIDVLFSSNYTRAISTAKYLADKNNIKINIDDDFGERKIGINDWDEKPKDFELKQFYDENYKMPNGESGKEVKERMYNALMKAVFENKNKRIAIVTHYTATLFLLKKLIDIDNDGNCYFNNNKIFNISEPTYCQTIKLVFNNDTLVNIENI